MQVQARQSCGVLPAAFCALLVVLIGGPQFVRMPLTNDAVLFDLQAKLLRDGGTLYRDMLEPNLPGVVWVHAAVRTAFGESTEALRIFDLIVFAGIAGLGVCWMRSAGAGLKAAAWFAAAIILFYLSLSEWCHCQRDMWLLFPTLAALTIRGRQTGAWIRLQSSPSASRQFVWSILEGLLWGSAIWIKPYALLSAAACWSVSQFLIRRRKNLLLDTSGLLIGGIAAGAAGVTWLIQTGAWPDFYTTLTEWNPRYFQAGREHWTTGRFAAMAVRIWPWSALHVVAVPVAVLSIWRLASRPNSDDDASHTASSNAMAALFAAFYLAWCIHAFFLQHLFDYVHAPVLLLALLVIAGRVAAAASPQSQRWWRRAACAFALLAVVASPLVRADRLRTWSECVHGPNSPGLQDRLAHFRNPNRTDIARVAAFLQREGVRNQDVCCYNSDLVSLYPMLGLMPPTRYVYLHELLVFFPERSDVIADALNHSGHRFVVTDLASGGIPLPLAEEIGPAGPLAPPPAYRDLPQDRFPWSLPVVFRSGAYLVHLVDDPASGITVLSTRQ